MDILSFALGIAFLIFLYNCYLEYLKYRIKAEPEPIQVKQEPNSVIDRIEDLPKKAEMKVVK